MTAVLAGPVPARAAWLAALPLLAGVLLVLLWQYWASFAAMEAIWARSDTFAHAYLVPPIVLWLIWRSRDRVLALAPRPQPWALLPLGLCAGAWLVGDLAGVNAVTQLAVTGLLVCTVPAILGWPVARALAFPLGFLFFMVPVGEFAMPQMMEWTADVTVLVLRLIGIPVYREGLQFVIPSGSWSVVEACSGVRYLIASFMVGTLFAYLNYSSLSKRLLFVLVSLLVPIVANWARAVMIVLLGHFSGNTLAVGVDHLVYGWVFFGVVIGVMFFIGSRWADAPAGDKAAGDVSQLQHVSWARAGSVALAAVLLLVAPGLYTAKQQRIVLQAPALQLPALAQGESGTTEPLHLPHFHGARTQAVGAYRLGDQTLTVHVAYYRQQTYGHKLVNSQNSLIGSDAEGWRRTASGASVVQVGGQAVRLRAAELRSGGLFGTRAGTTLQVRQIYWVGGRWTTQDPLAVLLGVFGQLSGQGDDAAAITFSLTGDAGVSAALDSFVASSLPELGAWLHNVQTNR